MIDARWPLVAVFAAYVAGRTLGPGAPYLEVFRVTGAVTFIGHTGAVWVQSIWFYRSWGTTSKHVADGLVYALLTGGIFGWLW